MTGAEGPRPHERRDRHERGTSGRRRRRDVVVVAALVLTGCGVEPQRSPEPVPADRLPSAAPSPQSTGASAPLRVWGAREARLVPVFVEETGAGTGVAARIGALLALAEPGQRAPTVLRPGTRLVRLVRSGDAVELRFSDELRRVPMADLPLALGQIVLTATEQPDVIRVDVLAGDAPVRYVDATGRRITRPLVRADFADLARSDAD